MRKFVCINLIALTSLIAAPVVSASCCHMVTPLNTTNSAQVSLESGVKVYRARPVISTARLQAMAQLDAENARAKAVADAARAQAQAAATQQARTNERLAAIEARQETLIALQTQNQSYQNRYYGPQFLQPNRIFFGDYTVWQGPQYLAARRGTRTAPSLGF